jgi:zinc transport system substrate-binding protein
MKVVPAVGVIGVLLAFATIPFLLVGCGPAADPWAGQPGPPRVVVSFAPLECFVRNVGGDNVGVLSICSTGSPHHFDPPVDEANKLTRADLVFSNGLGLDDAFMKRLADASRNPKLRGKDQTGFIELGDRMAEEKPSLVFKEEADDKDHAHGHDDHHGDYDPHIWLGIPQAIRMVEIIRDELKKVDSARSADYDRRASEYIDRLKKLEADGKEMLKDKKNRSIVTTHDSCHYFAASFGLAVEGVLEATPGNEGDAVALKELITKCVKQNVRVIATEPKFATQEGAAKALLKDLHGRGVTDAQIIELDPLETVTGSDKTADAGWYERGMRKNLEALAKALQ